MDLPRGRGRPVMFLLLLAPLIAEVLFGTTTVTGIAAYVAQIGLYGGGAVLIREVTRRWGGGWPTILLLGAAYGAIEEGLLEPTWFTPQLQSHPYGVALGVFWTYAAFNIVYHAVFSIAIPILLTELVFPRWRDELWLGRAGLAVTGAVYAVNAAAIGVLWWTVLQASVFHVPARAHPVQQGTTVALVIVLIVAAWRSAPARLFTPGGARPPPAGRLGAAAALATLAWFGLLLASGSANDLRWLPAPVPVAVAAAGVALTARALRRWPARTDRQLLAACSGALVVQMVAGFGVAGFDGPVNIIGKAVLNIAAVGLLWGLGRRLARDDARPVPGPGLPPPRRGASRVTGAGHDQTALEET